MMMGDSMSESLANLVATIESVAAGDTTNMEASNDTQLVTAEMLEGVLHLSNGQSINVVQMSGSLEDTINVVQVETSELDDHVTTMEELCAIDIDEEQKHILSETGAHVIVNTEDEVIGSSQVTQEQQGSHDGLHAGDRASSVALSAIPFSFPGQTFDVKCQKLILNVWDFFRKLKKNPDILDEIRTPQERAAAALHISAATIGKIGKNFRRTGKLEAPGRKRKRAKPVVDSVKPEHELIIRDIIKEFKTSRVTPTLPLLLNECRERINFQGGSTSFRRILQRMGYKGLTSTLTNQRYTYTHHHPPKAKQSSTSNPISTTSASKPSETRVRPSPKATKTVSIDNSFLSIPLTTPVTSSPKKVGIRAVIPSTSSSTPLPSKTQSSYPKLASSLVSLFGGNLFQLGTPKQGEQFSISQPTAGALATGTRVGEATQTIHVLQPDNTLQQFQILYTTNMTT